MTDLRLKILYGRSGTKSLRRLYPQLPTGMLLRHGDKLLAHASLDYERVVKPITRTIHRLHQDWEDQHVKRYLREYPLFAQPETIIAFIQQEQEKNIDRLLLDYPLTREWCLVRALGMRPFAVDRQLRNDPVVRQNIKRLITQLPYKSFCQSYRSYLRRVLSLLKSCLQQSRLDELHNYQCYFESFVALMDNAAVYCPEVLKGEVQEAELACTAVLYYLRAMHLYNSNSQICDRLFLASVQFTN